MNKQPKITLVGAGPGAADLISVRGLNALRAADVVLYDALVSQELLDEIPADVPKIYVGKRANKHSYSQDAINALLVECARLYGHVVRLKGGDSFVFGRGGEEVNFARSYNIPTTVVPGISSAIGVPALGNIPVTQRGVSESFWVITGTTLRGELSEDIIAAAATNATVVILMGLSKLPEIIEVYQSMQKGHLAIAVIQEGSLHSQQVVVSKIDDVIQAVSNQKIQPPAVIVIGEVVSSIIPEIIKDNYANTSVESAY